MEFFFGIFFCIKPAYWTIQLYYRREPSLLLVLITELPTLVGRKSKQTLLTLLLLVLMSLPFNHLLTLMCAVLHFSPDEMKQMMGVNVISTSLCTQLSIKLMLKKGIDDGHIIFNSRFVICNPKVCTKYWKHWPFLSQAHPFDFFFVLVFWLIYHQPTQVLPSILLQSMLWKFYLKVLDKR